MNCLQMNHLVGKQFISKTKNFFFNKLKLIVVIEIRGMVAMNVQNNPILQLAALIKSWNHCGL